MNSNKGLQMNPASHQGYQKMKFKTGRLRNKNMRSPPMESESSRREYKRIQEEREAVRQEWLLLKKRSDELDYELQLNEAAVLERKESRLAFDFFFSEFSDQSEGVHIQGFQNDQYQCENRRNNVNSSAKPYTHYETQQFGNGYSSVYNRVVYQKPREQTEQFFRQQSTSKIKHFRNRQSRRRVTQRYASSQKTSQSVNNNNSFKRRKV